MHGLVYADVRYMSKFNTGSDLDIEKTQEAFAIVNARIGIEGPDDALGRSNSGRRTCSTRITSRSRSTRRSRAVGTHARR